MTHPVVLFKENKQLYDIYSVFFNSTCFSCKCIFLCGLNENADFCVRLCDFLVAMQIPGENSEVVRPLSPRRRFRPALRPWDQGTLYPEEERAREVTHVLLVPVLKPYSQPWTSSTRLPQRTCRPLFCWKLM